MSGAGKGSARRRTSDASKYAAGWNRVYGWKRVKRDPGPGKGTSSKLESNTPSDDIVKAY